MSTFSCDPAGESDAASPRDTHPDGPGLVSVFDDIEHQVLVIEPSLRDANRHLRDLLGACPQSVTGEWIRIDDAGSIVLNIDLAGLGQLATTCGRLAARADDDGDGSLLGTGRDSTAWVSGSDGYVPEPSSPHLPTGAELRHRDSRGS